MYSSNPTRATLIAIRGIERKASLGERVLPASLLPSLLNIIFRALLGFLFARVMRRPTGTRVFELGRGARRGVVLGFSLVLGLLCVRVP